MSQHIVTPVRVDGTNAPRIRVIGARNGVEAIKLAQLGAAREFRTCHCESASHEWRVWLFGEELPRIVVTEQPEPMFAIACAMNAANKSAREPIKAARVELLGQDGAVVRKWAY